MRTYVNELSEGVKVAVLGETFMNSRAFLKISSIHLMFYNQQWVHPEEVLHLYSNGGIKFAGPQSYELSRIARFSLLSDLHEFIQRRAFLGCQHNCPKIYVMKDGALSVYEGL